MYLSGQPDFPAGWAQGQTGEPATARGADARPKGRVPTTAEWHRRDSRNCHPSEVGVYQYRRPLDNAPAYKAKLVGLQAQIEDSVKAGRAVVGSPNWTVNGSVTKGSRMVKELSKLMLRVYNDEADDAVRSRKPYTWESSIDRNCTHPLLAAERQLRTSPGRIRHSGQHFAGLLHLASTVGCQWGGERGHLVANARSRYGTDTGTKSCHLARPQTSTEVVFFESRRAS